MWEQVVKFVTEQLAQNELLAGGAVLAALVAAFNYLRRVPFLLMQWSRFLLVSEVDIPDRTRVFGWVSRWVAQHKYARKARRVSVETHKGDDAEYTPAPGWHLIWWKKRPLILRRVRKEGTGELASRAFRETWKITVFGRRHLVDSFIVECLEAARHEAKQFIDVHEAMNGYWNNPVRKPKRSIESVILAPTTKVRLIDDITKFINSKEWYREMNIPWRRGYLLHGPPGNGKSSLITAVASMLDYSVYIMALKGMGEQDFSSLMQDVPEKAILLMEDIDCLMNRDGKDEALSFSTLLNCLDGVVASEGRLVFMTTNHPERLDPALTRPGRVDMNVEIPNATQPQIARLYKRFYPSSKNGEEFAGWLKDSGVSMAQLQNYFLQHRDSCKQARANIKELLREVQDSKQRLPADDEPRNADAESGGHDLRGPTRQHQSGVRRSR